MPTDTFGTRLLLIRRELGMTVKAAAQECGIHYATWSTWENGSKPADLVRVVTQIHQGLGVDRDWLMWGQTQNAPRPGGPGGGESGRRDSNSQHSAWNVESSGTVVHPLFGVDEEVTEEQAA